MYSPPSAKATNFLLSSGDISQVDSQLTDPFYNQVEILMKCHGDLQDDIGHSFITYNNSFPRINLGESRDGKGCLDLTGINYPNMFVTTSDLYLTDYTNACIEFWAKFPVNNIEDRILIVNNFTSISSYNWAVIVDSNNNIKLFVGDGSSTQIGHPGITIPQLSTWNHYAFVKNGKTWKGYLNGVLVSSNDYSLIMSNTSKQSLNIGSVTNIASYPSTVKLNLLFEDNLADSSSFNNPITVSGRVTLSNTQSRYGNYSAQFNGDGYLCTPNDAVLFGTQDFTVELWFYTSNLNNSPVFWHCFNNANGDGWFMEMTPAIIYVGTTSTIYYSITSTIPLNAWNHIALTRVGSTLRIFLNGVLLDTRSFSGAENNHGTLGKMYIGTWKPITTSNQYDYTGYIDEFRVTIGQAKYLTSFTPVQLDTIPKYSQPICYLDDIRMTIGEQRYYHDFNLFNSQNYLFTKSGTVYDNNGLPCKRLVRLYRRSDGSLVNETYSDSVTGTWTLTTPYSDSHFIVVFDDSCGKYNSLLLDRI